MELWGEKVRNRKAFKRIYVPTINDQGKTLAISVCQKENGESEGPGHWAKQAVSFCFQIFLSVICELPPNGLLIQSRSVPNDSKSLKTMLVMSDESSYTWPCKFFMLFLWKIAS